MSLLLGALRPQNHPLTVEAAPLEVVGAAAPAVAEGLSPLFSTFSSGGPLSSAGVPVDEGVPRPLSSLLLGSSRYGVGGRLNSGVPTTGSEADRAASASLFADWAASCALRASAFAASISARS